MFDLLGKGLKYAKELLLNHYRKSVQNSEVAGHACVELKLVTNHLRKMFRSHTQGSRTQYCSQEKLIETNS